MSTHMLSPDILSHQHYGMVSTAILDSGQDEMYWLLDDYLFQQSLICLFESQVLQRWSEQAVVSFMNVQ